MSRKCFIYYNILFFVVNVLPLLAFENRYSTYELDFSSEDREFLVNTNSKFSFFFKDDAWIYIKNVKNNSFVRLLGESYQEGAIFTFQTSKNVGKIILSFSYQNVKDSKEFTKNVILKIVKKDDSSKLDEMNPRDSLDLSKDIEVSKSLRSNDQTDGVSSKEIIRRALNLSYIDDYKGAIGLLNKYDFDDNDYILLKAEFYCKNGDYLNAYASYLSIRDQYFNKVFLNLISLGIKLNKVEDVLRNVRVLIEGNIDFGESIYLDILEFLLMSGEYEFFLNLSSLYFPKYVNSNFPDRYNYLLGRLYETESKYKDFIKSFNHYRSVIDSYPFSNYYEISKSRYLFLKRFF
ncbi:hypothetical protein CR532_00210 [Candidatus Borreliella tachyglossi]|uniref:Uncharacterized protein n=1 Tax=Candidatus Borreliella tachyglossi TaxID=1964448 RepID=A0A2S1LVZ3_9SPIR|nr:hypothetical protein [Candidatus Borreliella tachyglossi]AWG42448.1 hypothetical protein CR532_00210 [Candidatus Borreliella tachyglossi]